MNIEARERTESEMTEVSSLANWETGGWQLQK